MSDLQTTTITDVLGDDRWAANRIAGLAPASRRLYALILYRFTEGAPPDRDELSDLGFGGEALLELVQHDLVQLDPDGEVAVAYPFSASPTRHRVLTEDGRAYWADTPALTDDRNAAPTRSTKPQPITGSPRLPFRGPNTTAAAADSR